jgi:Tol biopolymer transport system component
MRRRGLRATWAIGLAACTLACGTGSDASSNRAAPDASLPHDASSPADAPPDDDDDVVSSAAATQHMVFMWAPDGGPIVAGPAARDEVALMNLDGGGFQQITSDGTLKFLPHFSPDGRKIAYTKFAVGGYGSPDAQTDIAVYDLATRTESVITSGGRSGYASWSPDGKRLVYMLDAKISGLAKGNGTLMTVRVDGTGPQTVASARGSEDDMFWPGDLLWSNDGRILFVVAQNVGNCFKARIDTILPDGSQRTQVTDGGAKCTVPGFEATGDADPGWSHDGKTIYSSRGFPNPPAGVPDGGMATERKLYSFSSDGWYSGKPEADLSLMSEPSCIEGMPRGSPDGTHVLLFRLCFAYGMPPPGIYVTDTTGSYRAFVTAGFGPDWNPVARP